MGSNNIQDMSDKEFYRDLVKELVNISRVNSENIKENNKIVQELAGEVREFKTALQSKPCIAGKVDEVVNKGWEESSQTTYKWFIGGLLGLIAGILASVGLYVK